MGRIVDIYGPYMHSGLWYRRRRALIGVIGESCELCGAPGRDVHHVSYRNFMNELPSDVVSVCRSCHDSCKKDPATDWAAKRIAYSHRKWNEQFKSTYKDTRPRRRKRRQA